MPTIKNLLRRPGMRYLIIGGSVYILEIAIILGLQWQGAGPVLAVAISYVLGTLVSFGLQKFVTFGDRRTHHTVVLSQLLATVALVVFNFGFTLVVTRVFAHTLPAIISRTVALAICTLWNFYLYKTRIFKSAASTYTVEQ